MYNRSAEPRDYTRVIEALSDKLDIKRHSPGILYLYTQQKSLRGIKCAFPLLAHLSRRLIAELIVYPCSGVRGCRGRRGRQQFQTSSPLKPFGQSKPNFLILWMLGMEYVILLWHSLSLPYNYFFMWSLLGEGESKLYKWSRLHYQDGRQAHIW